MHFLLVAFNFQITIILFLNISPPIKLRFYSVLISDIFTGFF